MKHVFIVNPAAGRFDATDFVRQKVEQFGDEIDFEIYRTSKPGDATEYIKSVLADEVNEYRFYSCGGDGTLNEVINGVAGHSNASVTVYPCGSGNDFIKYYGTYEDFCDLSELINAKSHKIDLLKVGDSYAVNAVHFGFDTFVLKTMIKVRRKKIIGGKNAYTTGVVAGLVSGMKSHCSLTVDGEPIDTDEFLLCTLCNGKYVGGSYKAAPRSDNSDGLIEVCHVKTLSRIKFISLISAYKNGTHLDDSRLDKYITYKRGKKIEIDGGEDFYLSLDGELKTVGKCTVEVIHNAINFAVPDKLMHISSVKEEETVVG